VATAWPGEAHGDPGRKAALAWRSGASQRGRGNARGSQLVLGERRCRARFLLLPRRAHAAYQSWVVMMVLLALRSGASVEPLR
jgi:hypothetical protein